LAPQAQINVAKIAPNHRCASIFSPSAQPFPESGLAGGWLRQPSQRVKVDRGQFVGLDLDDLYVVMHLREFAPVGRRPASERKRRRLERLAKMCENLTDGPRL